MPGTEIPYEDLESQEQIEALMCTGGGTAVIDFWAPTCGPCLAMARDFAHVASQFEPNELRFCKIDTSRHPELAAAFNIMSIPTILFVHDGEILDATVGKLSAADLGRRSEWLLRKASRGPGLLRRLLGRRPSEPSS